MGVGYSHEIDKERAAYEQGYLERWERMLAAWRQRSTRDAVWLMFSANYLCNSGGVRWALDPVRPTRILAGLPRPVPLEPLRALDFVLLSHAHGDHFDPELLASLRSSPCLIVTPEWMLPLLREETGIPEYRLVVARPGQSLAIKDVTVMPFASWHEEGGKQRLPELGYQVISKRQRWLFPVDVRTYTPQALVPFAGPDVLFAHVWLGRGQGEHPSPPLLKAFCGFAAGAAPRTLFLAHLNQYNRSPASLWTRRHAGLIREFWENRYPPLPILSPDIGEQTAW